MTENKTRTKDDTIFLIGVITFVALVVIALVALIATGKLNIKDKISGMKSAISAKKTEIADQASTGVNQMKAQIAKAVSGDTTILKVTFDTGSSAIGEDARKNILHVAGKCKKTPNMKVQLQGYADTTGNSLKNIALSVDRVKSVRNVFEYYGCKNIEDGGFGSQIPERQVVVTVTN